MESVTMTKSVDETEAKNGSRGSETASRGRAKRPAQAKTLRASRGSARKALPAAPSPITAAAQRIADLCALSAQMDEAVVSLAKQRDQIVGRDEVALRARANIPSSSLFEAVHVDSHDTLEATRAFLMRLEPESLDDVLTLAVLAASEMEQLNLDTADRNDKRMARIIEGVFSAIIRGLVQGGASTPLLDRIIHRQHLLTRDELAAKAVRSMP